MNLLFLTNNELSVPLADWLSERSDLTLWRDKFTLDEFLALQPDIVVSYSYRILIEPAILAAKPNRFVNLHPSLLPYNRGSDPNAWSFLEDTPKGVTIHVIDEGIDTGPVLVQQQVEFDEDGETLKNTYETLHVVMQRLFREHWDAIRDNAIVPQPQTSKGTIHYARQYAIIRELLGEEGWDVAIPVFKERYRRMQGARVT